MHWVWWKDGYLVEIGSQQGPSKCSEI
jgi:hypothetical protein